MNKALLDILVRAICFAVVIGNIVLFGKAMLVKTYTPDLPWILRSGQHMIESHTIPFHDIFSWTLPEKPWLLYQWLFEVLIAVINNWGGEQGLLKGFIVVVITLYVVLPFIKGEKDKIPMIFSILVPSFALIMVAVNMSLRPMIMTSIFLAVQFLILQAFRKKELSFKMILLVLIPVYILWGNMHTGVVLGLVSLVLFKTGDWLESRQWYIFSPPIKEEKGQAVSPNLYIILIGVCFLASLINPYGFGIYQYLTDLSNQTFLNDAIVELRSPDFHIMNYWYFAGFIALLILLMPKATRIFSAHELLHLWFFTFFALIVQRMIIWTGLFYALILPGALYYVWLEKESDWGFIRQVVRKFQIYRPLWISFCFVTITGFMFYTSPVTAVSYGPCTSLLPGIAAYQNLKLPSDRTFVEPEIGSCTMIKYPSEKIFADTRFDFYETNFTRQWKEALDLSGDWKGFFNKWGINTIVITKRWPLSYLLKTVEGYQKLYEDDKILIFRYQRLKHEELTRL